jgi:signal transduction histidine kinase
MVINPSIEIYLLSPDGTILSYSADPARVKRRRVSLAPIHAFLEGAGDLPLLGDDPRSHDRRKAFSVTPVPSAEDLQGYLYVVLRGEEFDSIEQMIRGNLLLHLSAWAVAGSLGLGLVAGLLLLHLLTRRLHRLARLMGGFRDSGFTAHVPYAPPPAGGRRGDEVDELGLTFDQMAARIMAQLDELRETDGRRREMVAQVSHDLRTPLASLHGYLETLQLKGGTLSEAERTEFLQIALQHSERLTRLVAELFELAKLDAKETQPQREPFAPAELVQDVLQKYQLRAARQGIRLLMDPAENLPLVHADIALIERVLENLLDNAIGHTPPAGTVRVSLRRDGDRVAVTVADTGCGIPAADLPRVFDRFYQADNRHRGGTHAGLGLAIVKRILELHGGAIRVASVLGEGTTFVFSLPL